MSTLLTARTIAKSSGATHLFSGVDLAFAEGDRLGVIGPNGAGKSTLLRIFAGSEEPDEGEVVRRRGLRAAYVAQHDEFGGATTPLEAVVAALIDDDPNGLDRETRAAITLSQLGFDDHDVRLDTLSGGWRKRVSIATAVANDPDILMLDEPTNHLDLEGVEWLERFATQTRSALALITHDRTFLDRVATRIVELSRAYPGGTFEVKGNYTEFVRRKDAFLDAQREQQSVVANLVRRDTAWLRQGVQGRQTRNQSQVDAAADRRAALAELTERNLAPTKTTAIDFRATERKSTKLLSAHSLRKSLGGKLLFEGLDLMLSPGTRIGLLGPNGAGKTTLLRVLAGEAEPDGGTVKNAAELKVVTFSQHRETLDPNDTLQQALCPVGDVVHLGDKAIHVSGWASRFLFEPNQLAVPVGTLSGGEQARVLIANLMLQAADVLLLDEPTNDLDIPSLEVLEEAISSFPGAVILVTHDRFMLRRLATEILALDGRGHAKTYASFEQWQRDHAKREAEHAAAAKTTKTPAPKREKPKVKKLTYAEQLEFEAMEGSILEAEGEVERLEAKVADPELLADHVRYGEACRELEEAQQRVASLYERWTDLESRA